MNRGSNNLTVPLLKEEVRFSGGSGFEIVLVNKRGSFCGFWDVDCDCFTWALPAATYLKKSRGAVDSCIKNSWKLRSFLEEAGYKAVIAGHTSFCSLEVLE